MNRVRNFVVAAGVVALMSGGAVALFAQGAPGRGAGPFGPGGQARRGFDAGFALGQLNLSDAQKQQLRDIMQRTNQILLSLDKTPLMQQLHQTRQQLRQYEEGTFDEAKVRALATQEAQTNVELTVQHARIHNELFQMLTPDQQAKAKELEAQAQTRGQDRRQHAPKQRKQPV